MKILSCACCAVLAGLVVCGGIVVSCERKKPAKSSATYVIETGNVLGNLPANPTRNELIEAEQKVLEILDDYKAVAGLDWDRCYGITCGRLALLHSDCSDGKDKAYMEEATSAFSATESDVIELVVGVDRSMAPYALEYREKHHAGTEARAGN